MTTPETRARLGALERQLTTPTPTPLVGQTALPVSDLAGATMADIDDLTGAPRPALNAGDALLGEAINFDRITTASVFTLPGPDGQPLVTLDLATGVMTYGPSYTPDAAAEEFWDAVDQIGLAPVRRDIAAAAAKERAWKLVGEWRAAAVARGEDPYADPHAQALAAALIDPSSTAATS